MARETNSRVQGRPEPPGPGRNHYRQTVILPGGARIRVLLNAAIWLVACQEEGDIGMPFLDVPRPDLFELAGLYVAAREDLEQPLPPTDTTGLCEAEVLDIAYHRPARVGDVLYNWFD